MDFECFLHVFMFNKCVSLQFFFPEHHMSRAILPHYNAFCYNERLPLHLCPEWTEGEECHCMLELSSPLCFSPQEFLSDRDQGQSKLNAVVVNGELVCSTAAKDKVDAVRAKMNTAREDWKNMMTNLHNRETSLQVSTKNVPSHQ